MTIVISPRGDILQLEDHFDCPKALVVDVEALKSRCAGALAGRSKR